MLYNLNEEIRECYAYAKACARQAESAPISDKKRSELLLLEERWLELARSWEFELLLETWSDEPQRETADNIEVVGTAPTIIIAATSSDPAMIERSISTVTALSSTDTCKLGCEGIVSKRLDLPYRAGCSPHWNKVKNPAAPADLADPSSNTRIPPSKR